MMWLRLRSCGFGSFAAANALSHQLSLNLNLNLNLNMRHPKIIDPIDKVCSYLLMICILLAILKGIIGF